MTTVLQKFCLYSCKEKLQQFGRHAVYGPSTATVLMATMYSYGTEYLDHYSST